MVTKLDGKFIPGGRLVMGSLTEKDEKDYDSKVIPEDKRRYFFGVAVPKDNPEVGPLINEIWQMAATDYASAPLVMAQINQGLAAKDFAWKIDDGDAQTFDRKTGKPRDIPDYLKGCFIFKFSTQFEFDACDENGIQLNRKDIKRGDYVDVMFNSSVNGQMDDTAGIYLNPLAIRRLGFGDAIGSGVNASAAFANRAPVRPAGASSMPTAGGATPPATGGMPGNAAPAQMPTDHAGAGQMPGMGGGVQQQTVSQPADTTPHMQILQGPQGGGMPGM